MEASDFNSPVISDIYTLDAYGALFKHAQQLLLLDVQSGQDLPRTFLIDLYASRFDLPTLLLRSQTKLATLYTPTMTKAEAGFVQTSLDAIPMRRGRQSLMVDTDEMTQYATWREKNYPQLGELVRIAQKSAKRIVFPRVLDLPHGGNQLGGFLDNVCDGLTLLHMSLHIDDGYFETMLQRQRHFEKWRQYQKNVWLWHARALQAGLWSLDIDTTILNTVIYAGINDPAKPHLELLHNAP